MITRILLPSPSHQFIVEIRSAEAVPVNSLLLTHAKKAATQNTFGSMLQMPLVFWSQSPFQRMLAVEEATPARGEGDRSHAPVAKLHKGGLLLSSLVLGEVFTQH